MSASLEHPEPNKISLDELYQKKLICHVPDRYLIKNSGKLFIAE
jgi:hypothetical protein